MRKSIFLFLWLVSFTPPILIISCNSKNTLDGEALFVVDINKSLSTDSLISPRGLLTDVEYIPLVSSDTFFLTAAKKILQLGNKLFILDANKEILVAYDLQGNFIGQVGKKGMGPEEYKSVEDFVVSPKQNSIIVFSRADQAILEFNSDLSFKRKVSLNIWAFQMSLLESGNIALYTCLLNEDGFNILVYNYEGDPVDSKMPFPQIGQYIPMNYTGFIEGNYYTYPLSSKIFKLEEDKSADFEMFDVIFPGNRQEAMKFNHADFLDHRNWMKSHILAKFTIGNNAEELLFYYSFKENEDTGYTLGAKLSSGQVFGHLNLKHGYKSQSDMFVKLFFTGPYNLPTYSSDSGYYYVATDVELMTEFFYSDKSTSLKEIDQIDGDLHRVLKDQKDHENPVIMKFKLRKNI